MTGKAKSATPVRKALRPGSPLLPLVQDGLGALLPVDRARIDEAIRKDFADSLDIDAGLKVGHEADHRWDYGSGRQ